MPGYTKEDIVRIVRDEKVEFIRLQFTDIFGMLKAWRSRRNSWKRRLTTCMFDGSSIEGFVRIEESDMYLWPTSIHLSFCRGIPRSERPQGSSVMYIPRTASL